MSFAPLWGRLLCGGIGAVTFVSWAYLLMPKTVVISRHRGWPLIVTLPAIYLIPAVPFAVVASQPFSNALFGWNMVSVITIVTLTWAVELLLLQSYELPKHAMKLTSAEIWTGRRHSTCALQDELPKEIRAPVLRLEANNQYTRVLTQYGETLLRITLSEAEALTDSTRGMRVHRSHWIAFEEIEKLGFKKGNPRLKTKGGDTLPISRKVYAELKKRLNLFEAS